jgi:hypothetical protein
MLSDMTGFAVLVTSLVVIVLLALVVVGLVVLVQRGRRVPRVAPLSLRIERAARRVIPPESSPGYGELSSPRRARRVSWRFERAEQQVAAALKSPRQAVARMRAATLGRMSDGEVQRPRHAAGLRD